MKKGVIYARYSCDKQTENSTKAQIRECTEWAKKNDIQVIDIYKDEAISGRTDKRPAFQKMIADAKLHLFEAVIVWKGDRFSRSRADAAKYKTMLKHLGIAVLSATEANLVGPEAVLMDGINEAFAEYYSVELAAKVVRGQDQNFLEGRYNGGPVPIGFRLNKETHRMDIDEEEAKIVRDMFDRYVNHDQCPNQIREHYLPLGYSLGKGGIVKLLQNEKYIGVWRRKGQVNRTVFPAIVDEELFKQAQAKIGQNHTRSKAFRTADRFILVGKAFCGHCHNALVSSTGTGRNGVKHRYYFCPGNRSHACTLPTFKKRALEDAVLRSVVNVLNDTEGIQRLIKNLLELEMEQNPEIDNINQRIKAVERKITNYTTAIAMAGDITSLIEALKKANEEKKALESELRTEQRKSSFLSEDQLQAFFEHLKTISIEEEENRIFLVNTFVNKVFVYDDGGVTVMLNYRGQDGVFLKSTSVRLADTMFHHFLFLVS